MATPPTRRVHTPGARPRRTIEVASPAGRAAALGSCVHSSPHVAQETRTEAAPPLPPSDPYHIRWTCSGAQPGTFLTTRVSLVGMMGGQCSHHHLTPSFGGGRFGLSGSQ